MRRFLDRLYLSSGVLAAASLAVICALMLAQAFARSVGLQIRGTDDIVAWLCAACAFLALAHTFRSGDLVRVGVFVDRLPPKARRAAEMTALVIATAFVAYMLWAVTRFVYDSWQFKEVAQGLIKVPIWIPQLSLVAGIAIFFVALLDELVAVARGRTPSYQAAEEARRAAGDFSETL
jgi:TRAP-type C4-dicarboxylate transport system permease small subunit